MMPWFKYFITIFIFLVLELQILSDLCFAWFPLIVSIVSVLEITLIYLVYINNISSSSHEVNFRYYSKLENSRKVIAINLTRQFSTSRYLASSKKESKDKGSEEIQPTDQFREAAAAKLAIEKAIKDYKPDTSFSPEIFKQLANGVFQAEGCVTAWFNGGSLLVSPIVSVGQTYSPQSLAFFVRLYHEIGKIGKLVVGINPTGKLFITWQITNWSLILSSVSEYFSSVYGEKFMGFQKLNTIYKLKSNLTDDKDKVELVKLVYSLTSAGRKRKLSLEEKLRSLNLGGTLENFSSEFKTSFRENSKVPSFLFLLGFLLGDGSIYLRIRLTSSGSLNFIPSLNFLQKYEDKYIPHMFSMISSLLQSLGINSLVTAENKAGTTSLRIEGIDAVTPLVPLFKEYSSLGYWKSDDINMLLTFLKYHSAGLQTYKKGLIAMLNILYKDPNNRTRSFSEWEKLIEDYFNNANKKYVSGYRFVSPIFKNDKQAGWLVRFSLKLVRVDGQKVNNKSFLFSTYDTEIKALEAAIKYRDSVLESHLKEWQSSKGV